MDAIYAEIELLNGDDLVLLRSGHVSKDQLKRMVVTMKVDARTVMPAINECIQEQLKIPVVDRRQVRLASDRSVYCDIVAPLEIRFRNRATTCRAIVLPGDSAPSLGAIAINDMDVLIHPLRQELIVNRDHPYFAVMKMK